MGGVSCNLAHWVFNTSYVIKVIAQMGVSVPAFGVNFRGLGVV
jgi:hypothetical protein